MDGGDVGAKGLLSCGPSKGRDRETESEGERGGTYDEEIVENVIKVSHCCSMSKLYVREIAYPQQKERRMTSRCQVLRNEVEMKRVGWRRLLSDRFQCWNM